MTLWEYRLVSFFGHFLVWGLFQLSIPPSTALVCCLVRFPRPRELGPSPPLPSEFLPPAPVHSGRPRSNPALPPHPPPSAIPRTDRPARDDRIPSLRCTPLRRVPGSTRRGRKRHEQPADQAGRIANPCPPCRTRIASKSSPDSGPRTRLSWGRAARPLSTSMAPIPAR